MPRYTQLKRLGEGSGGIVYRAWDNKAPGTHVALKKFKLGNDLGVPSEVLREISLLKALGPHPSIVALREIVHDRRNIWLVMDEACQDLSQITVPLTLPLVQNYMRQILQGLEHCHSHGVIHRDVKPNNILMDQEGHLRLADFGSGRLSAHNGAKTPDLCTLWYRAPELLRGHTNYSIPVDLWSAGCIFAELLTGQILFRSTTELEQLTCIDEVLQGKWPTTVSHPVALDLLQHLLRYEPHERLSARQALKHNFFSTDFTFTIGL